MADLNIDTTSGQYQQLLAGLSVLESRLATRKPLLLRLAKRGDKATLVAILNADPLLKDFLRLAKRANKFVIKLSRQVEAEL